MNTVLILLFAYFCGAIPTGYWVVKAWKQVDLTKVGSGSTGTTNVLRTAGKAAAALVFVVDVAKGYVPVLLAILVLEKGWVPEIANSLLGPWLPVAAAILALVGHSRSIFLNWRGGKSAATGLGVMMAMNLPAALCAFHFPRHRLVVPIRLSRIDDCRQLRADPDVSVRAGCYSLHRTLPVRGALC